MMLRHLSRRLLSHHCKAPLITPLHFFTSPLPQTTRLQSLLTRPFSSLDKPPPEYDDEIKVTKSLYTSSPSAKAKQITELQQHLSILLENPRQSKADLIELSLKIIEETSVLYPPDQPHPALARAYNDDGYIHKRLGNFEASLKSYHKSIELYRESVGKNNPNYCSVLSNLSLAYKELSQYNGDDETGTKESYTSMEKIGFLTRALEASDECLQIRESLLVKVNSSIAKEIEGPLQNNVEVVRKRLLKDILSSKISKGGIVMSQAIAVLNKSNPPPSRGKGKGDADVGGRNKNKGKVIFTKILSNAEVILRDCLQICSLEIHNNGLDHGNVLNSLALLLKIRGGLPTNSVNVVAVYNESMKMYEQSLAIREKIYTNKNHEDIIATRFSLAELCDLMGYEERAEFIRKRIIDDVMKDVEGKTGPGGVYDESGGGSEEGDEDDIDALLGIETRDDGGIEAIDEKGYEIMDAAKSNFDEPSLTAEEEGGEGEEGGAVDISEDNFTSTEPAKSADEFELRDVKLVDNDVATGGASDKLDANENEKKTVAVEKEKRPVVLGKSGRRVNSKNRK